VNSRVLALLSCVALVGAGVVAVAQTETTPPPPDANAAPAPGDNSAPAQSPESSQAPSTEQTTPPAAQPEAPPEATSQQKPATPAQKPGAVANVPPQPPIPTGPPPTPPNAVLLMTGLDKITGRPARIVAHLNQPVEFATFTITARYCYSTPPSETPETSAFLQIDDHRPDQAPRRVFSGWMYASSPGLNAVQHPLYDVWVISCSANVPGQVRPTVATAGAVKVRSPDSSDKEGIEALPEGAGQ